VGLGFEGGGGLEGLLERFSDLNVCVSTYKGRATNEIVLVED